jgi:hypothetical protein
VQHFLGIKCYQTVEIQRRTSELKIEEHANRMGQDLNQAVLKAPQIMGTGAVNSVAVEETDKQNSERLCRAGRHS